MYIHIQPTYNSEDWDAWHARHAVRSRVLPSGDNSRPLEWKVPGHVVKGNSYLPAGSIDSISRSSSLSFAIAKSVQRMSIGECVCVCVCVCVYV